MDFFIIVRKISLKIDLFSPENSENNFSLTKKTLEVLYKQGIKSDIDFDDNHAYEELDNLIEILVKNETFNLDYLLAFDTLTLKTIANFNRQEISNLDDELRDRTLSRSFRTEIIKQYER